MANRGLFTVLIVLLGLGILFAGGINTGYANATDDFRVANESLTVDYTAPQPVTEPETSDVTYTDTVIVYNSSGIQVANGTDYIWHAANGSVEWLDTTATAAGEPASITYEYSAPPQSNQAMYGALEIVSIGLVFLVLLLVGQWLFDVVGDW